MDQQELISLMEGEQPPITVKLEINVSCNAEGEATVAFPPELRPTLRLVEFLNQAIKERGLVLKHWQLTTEQETELKALENIKVRE